MISVPSQISMAPTEVIKTLQTPYGEVQSNDFNSVDAGSRNFDLKRNSSGAKLEEWSQIFSLQHNRWQSEFDDLKARFISDFERNKMRELNNSMPKVKQNRSFVIPNEYLPLEKRSVKFGQEGNKERLRRDKVIARKLIHNKTGTEERKRNRFMLNQDNSFPDIGQQIMNHRANSVAAIGRQLDN